MEAAPQMDQMNYASSCTTLGALGEFSGSIFPATRGGSTKIYTAHRTEVSNTWRLLNSPQLYWLRG